MKKNGGDGKYQQYIRMAFIRNNDEEEEHVNRRKKNRWESGCCSRSQDGAPKF